MVQRLPRQQMHQITLKLIQRPAERTRKFLRLLVDGVSHEIGATTDDKHQRRQHDQQCIVALDPRVLYQQIAGGRQKDGQQQPRETKDDHMGRRVDE